MHPASIASVSQSDVVQTQRRSDSACTTAHPSNQPLRTASQPASVADKARIEQELAELWRRFKRTGCEDDRNRLWVHYLPLVRYAAERLRGKLPEGVELDELMSAGMLGLRDALNTFDPDRGVKFETFCVPRLRGQMIDALRSMDWVPRLVRQRTLKMEQALRQFEFEHGRAPTQDELAEFVNLPEGEFNKMLRDAGPIGMASLDRPRFEHDDGHHAGGAETLQDTRQPNPLSNAMSRDFIREMLRGLSRTEQLIITLYYYEGMTMKEIGVTLDLSESRVSQMHASILRRIRAQHRGRYGTEEAA